MEHYTSNLRFRASVRLSNMQQIIHFGPMQCRQLMEHFDLPALGDFNVLSLQQSKFEWLFNLDQGGKYILGIPLHSTHAGKQCSSLHLLHLGLVGGTHGITQCFRVQYPSIPQHVLQLTESPTCHHNYSVLSLSNKEFSTYITC